MAAAWYGESADGGGLADRDRAGRQCRRIRDRIGVIVRSLHQSDLRDNGLAQG